jgi:alpha-tubulin suppressor-like RCC1 family protein
MDSSVPVMVVSPPASPVSQLSAGGIAFFGSHTCAIAPDTTLYCWGDSADGRLGIGPPGVLSPPYPTPQETHAVMPVADVSAGGEHTCAIANAGRVYCFGKNQRGQLGNTTTTSSNEPVAVVGLP